MIEALTIFSKSGLVLYQHEAPKSTLSTSTSNPSLSSQSNPSAVTKSNVNRDLLNQFINNALLSQSMTLSKQQQSQQIIIYPTNSSNSTSSSINGSSTKSRQSHSATTGMVVDWEYLEDIQNNNSSKKPWVAVAFYSEILVTRKDMSFVKRFLKSVLKEYALFYENTVNLGKGNGEDDGSFPNPLLFLDSKNLQLFDTTFQALWKRMEGWSKLASRNSDPNIAQKQQPQTKSSKGTNTNSSKKKNEKKKTVWHDGTGKITKASLAQLDRSKEANSSNQNTDSIEAAMADDSAALKEARAAYLPSTDEIPSWLEEDDAHDLTDTRNEEQENETSSSSSWSFQSLFHQMSGNKILTESDLTSPLTEMERMLISKNVAQEISHEICAGVKSKLVGTRMHTFSRIPSTVRAALEHSITQILSPHRDIDVLRQVLTKRDSYFRYSSNSNPNKPYVIVMVGINGVGKSTSLAKIAYYLKSNGCSPLLAACDTFRSGAVEQLGVHAKCLNVPLFHKGYAKDPSVVAKAAISSATENKQDVVLIDTAGRMQNNLPLMKALRKLIAENQPDLVVFVGEALVGNDGLHQLQMFDKALSSENRGDGTQGVDGIILSKFDTVGEKVGAALSMVKYSGKPVLFTGVGQKYGHLKKLSVNGVIKSLFS